MLADSPESLDILLEDALLLDDREAVAALFDRQRVAVASREGLMVGVQACQVLGAACFVASIQSIVVGRDLALVTGCGSVCVSRRGGDHGWRLLIVVLTSDHG